MKANTLSLLNSPWMITDSGASSMMPQLLSLVRGERQEKVENKIPVVFMSLDDDMDYDIPDTSSNSQYISVLSIKSPIFKYDQFCGPIGMRTMTRVLKEWEANDNIVGVVLDIDCPGGQASGLAEFADFIFNYSKPIVSYTDGLQASAAEYIASACRWKVANQYADFLASIGTRLKYVNLDGILTKEGAVIKDIFATGSPRKGEEEREMVENGSDALIIQNILNPYREQFVADMKRFRPDMDESLFEGQIVKPEEALSTKLIDQIGTIQNAFDKVVELSKTTKKKSTNKSNNTMSTTKKLPRVEAVLGLNAPLAITENGSFLQEEQLDTVESHLDTLETTNATLTTQLAEAATSQTAAVDAVQTQLTAATASLTATEAAVNSALTSAGLAVEGTLTEKLTALNTYTTAQGKKDGADHTNPKTDANSDTTKNFDFVDAKAGHNQLANELLK